MKLHIFKSVFIEVLNKHYRNTLYTLFYFFITFNVLNAQVSNFCTSIPTHQANSQDPDSIHYDRFGNSYDNARDTTQQLLIEVCNTGYINLIYEGNFTPEMMDCICDVFNYVFNTQNGIIQRRPNTLSCGDPVLEEPINIVIREDNTIQWMAASASYASFPSRGGCDNLTVNRAYQKINGGYVLPARNTNTSMVDGRILLNTTINWNTSFANDPAGDQLDLSSAVFHGIIHVLGFASLLNTNGNSRLANMLELYDKYLNVVPSFGHVSSSQPVLVNNSNCIENCWTLNDQAFPNSGDFANAIRDNCDPSGNYDFVFDNQIAPIRGGKGVLPSDDPQSLEFIGDMLTHLHQDCNSMTTTPYVMGDDLLNGHRRLILTSAEVNILCKLGYYFENMDCCFNVAHREPILNDAEDEDCCTKIYYVCEDEQLVIPKSELLCNDFSNMPDPGHQITDVFTNPENDPDIEITFDDNEIRITPHSQRTKTIYYTVTSCDCKMHNASFTIEVGPCLDCQTGSCQNLSCSNGFEEFAPRIGNREQPLYPVIALSDGIYWRFNTPIVNNTVDPCEEAGGNHYMHMVAAPGNQTVEGLCFKLKQPILFGCTLHLEVDAAKHNTSSSNTRPIKLNILGSQNPPCSALDMPINLGCGAPTNCTTLPYNPICLGIIDVTNYVSAATCGQSVDFQNYLLDWISNITNNPGMQSIEYITIYPDHDPDPTILAPAQMFIDNVIFTKTCFCEDEIVETQTTCTERNFQPNCTSSNHTYLWESSDGGNGSGINFDHVFQNGNHTITLTVIDECNNSIEITKDVVVACGLVCNHCPPNVIILANPLKTKLSDYNINSIPRLSCLIVKGKLIIDVDNIIFDYCQIYLEAGAEIYINPGITLTSWNSIFAGCDYMWKSITTPTGSKFIADHTTIMDAWRGIDASGSPTLNLTNNYFINNHVGIYVEEGTVFTDYPIQGNQFKTEGSFKLTYDFRTTPIIGYAGVQTLGGNITLGRDEEGSLGNDFYNLNNGFACIGSKINSFNSNISQMILINHLSPAANTDDGCGIYTKNCYLQAKYNHIDESIVAISCNDGGSKETIVEFNTIDQVIFGINVMNVVNIVKINNNIISYYSSGIGVVTPKLLNKFEIIKNDPITQLYGSTWMGGKGFGLSLIEVKAISGNQYSKVMLNKLFHINACVPMYIASCEKVAFQENTVDISGTNFYSISGITVNNSNTCNFYNNSVSGVTSNSPNANDACFEITGSSNNIFCNNHASGLSNGFLFRGTCTSDNNFRSNTMSNEYDGVLLIIASPPSYGPSIMGIQEFTGNEWNGSYSHASAVNHNADPFTRLRSQFKLNTCMQPFWPESIVPNQGVCDVSDPTNPFKWFSRIDGNNPIVCIPPIGLNQDSINEFFDNSDTLTINDEYTAFGQFGQSYSPINFEMPLDLFRKLNEKTDLIGLNNSIDSFYSANFATNIYEFYRVDSAIRSVYKFNAEEVSFINVLTRRSDSLRTLIRVNDSLLSVATDLEDSIEIANQTKFYTINLHMSLDIIDSIYSVQSSNRLALIPQILSWNESIVPIGVVEINRRITNQVLLQTIYYGITQLTEGQFDSISPIANQCVLTGGRGVLIARMLYELNETLIIDEGALCDPQEIILNSKETIESDYHFTILPNPTNEAFYIVNSYPYKSEKLSIELCDLRGNALYKGQLSSMERNLIDASQIHGLESGLFFVKIFDQGKLIYANKLVILK